MKLNSTFSLLFLFLATSAFAQRKLAVDSTVVTKHEVTIKGQRFGYTATTGTQPVWNEDGKAIASLYYTYYERNNVPNKAERPLVISFNGGPGSASVWMHIAYTGPRLLNVDDEGYPVQPYGIKENPYSILDVADIVFVNPVNTGFSRILDKEVSKSTFFGTNADVKYLAEWLNTFVNRANRWESPKYLIGESYGTTRVAGLALELQNSQWMYLNGVILVSPTDLGLARSGPVDQAMRLPYYAATAWYHKVLPPALQQKTLDELLPEVEKFTIDEYLPAMVRAGSLTAQEKQRMAGQIARYAGISEQVVLQNNLDISFTPAINHYIRNDLNYKTDVKYNMFGPVHPWDRSNDRTGENLRQAMAQNPYLHVMTQSGYFDGATDYFNAKYNHWQMDPSGKLQHRMSFKGYESGHMMYLRKADLETANEDIREFIKKSLPGKGVPAKYTFD